MFWIIAELAIIATDIAEVIGSAIALDLIFGIPLIVGALITVFDVFLLLFIMKFGFRKIEAIVGTLIFTVLAIFVFEVYISSPHIIDMLNGFVPHKRNYYKPRDTLYCTRHHRCYYYAT